MEILQKMTILYNIHKKNDKNYYDTAIRDNVHTQSEKPPIMCCLDGPSEYEGDDNGALTITSVIKS